MWILVLIASAVILALTAKLALLYRDLDRICDALDERLREETNTLICTGSGDRRVRRLAARLNERLRALRDARRSVRREDLELKEAVANVSHDLRTPLTAICGHLDLLEREEKSPEVARHLEVIAGRARAMRELTGELFRYSLAEEDVQTLEPERVNLNAALEEAVLSCFGALKERGIEPVIRMPDLPVERMLNRAALLRVLENILSNAIRYGDGDLEIELRGQGEMRISNGARSLDGVQVGRLFDRFYTVETGRGSTGLGLSIARLLIERMGGEIGAEYAAGRLEIWLRFSAAPLENVEIL